MTHVSRPLIGLLLATVVLFALWTVALKPHGSSGGAGGSANQGLGQYQADINAAHRAVGTANAASARAGAMPARTTAPTAPAAAHPTATVHPAATARAAQAARPRPVAHPAPARKPAETRLASVEHAIRSHRVVALLFYNPGAPDDRAVHQELAGVPTHGGRVFKLAIPVGEIRSYTSITEQLSVNLSPTLVLVAPDRQTDEIVGYADPFEISQRVDDALALR
ncbi:MAG TPA: hypothetical protein VGF81_05615 [Solirubrobacteraceae bacterium]|jgi:hypothetical protein